MFNLFKKKSNQNSITETLKLSGLHCTSCAVNIDLSLEDIKGVIESKTNYAKSETLVEFDPKIVSLGKINSVIKELGYTVE
ncbi:MAG TPA: heavy-metal-associated domain-containing protein [Patescibacteria group bacterium]